MLEFKNTRVGTKVTKEQLDNAVQLIQGYGLSEENSRSLLYVLGIQVFKADFISGTPLVVDTKGIETMPLFATNTNVQFFSFRYEAGNKISANFETGTTLKVKKGKSNYQYLIRTLDGQFKWSPENWIAVNDGQFTKHLEEMRAVIDSYNACNDSDIKEERKLCIKEMYKLISKINKGDSSEEESSYDIF